MQKFIRAVIFCFCLSGLGWAQPDFTIVGIATQSGGTTGGQGGQEVTVKTYADLKSHAESSEAFPSF